MTVPPWLTILITIMVTLFGLYRLRLALRSHAAEERAREGKGLYAMPRHRHALYGVIYLIMAAFLVAGLLGYQIFPSLFD